jgi:arylsulfatase A-like enzyme
MPPNVLVIVSDDQRFDFLPYMPNVMNMIVEPGRYFSTCRCNNGQCQPTRAGFLTGQNTKHHHVIDNSDVALANFDHNNTVGLWVHNAGYRTGLIGKYLNAAPPMQPQPAGWDTWRQIVEPTDGVSLGFSVCDGTTITMPPGFQMDYVRDEAIAFVGGTQPWFLVVTPSSPHFPFSPAPQDLFAWSDVRWPLVIEDDVSDKPSWMSSQPPLPESALDNFRATARAQLRELNGVDRSVAAILGSLAPDVLANTTIFYSSDNGLEYGEHRRPFVGISKNVPYEVGLRVPFAMRGPDIPAGVSNDVITMGADLTATVVGVTGATVGLQPDGVDLRDVIANPAAYASRQLLHFKDISDVFGSIPAGDGISTATRKLWRYKIDASAPETDRYEAYDLDIDPNEWNNWANDPTRIDERNSLDAALTALLDAP